MTSPDSPGRLASEKEQSIERALEFMRKRRPLRAEEVCRDYLSQHPGCVDHLRLLGHTLTKQRRLQEAEQQLRFALSMDEKFPQLYEDLGSVLSLQTRYEEAIEAFERAIRLEPGLPLVHKKLAQALAAAGRGDEAQSALEIYRDSDQDRSEIAAGVEHMHAERLDEAADVFRKVLKRSPDNVNAMRFLALTYWQGEKKLDDAEALLRRAVELAPTYTGAWLILGALLSERNKYVETIAAYKKATELEPKNAEAWGGLGNAYSMGMYPEEAVRAYARAVELQPNAPDAQAELAFSVTTSLDSWKYRKRQLAAPGDCCLSNGARYPNLPNAFTGHYRSHFMSSERMYLLEKYRPSPTCDFSFEQRSHPQHSTPDELRAMIALAHQQHIALKLFISPSHARQWEVIATAGLTVKWEAWKRELVKINHEEAARAGREAFPLWDFSGYNVISAETVPQEGDMQTAMRWYSDSSHYTPALGKVLLDKMFGLPLNEPDVPGDFGILLTPDTLESQLEAIRKGQVAYRSTHPADIAEIKQVAEEAGHRKYCTVVAD